MIRGSKRDLREVREAKLEASLHNRFDVEVVDAATGEVKQRARAENVICNKLWARLLTPNSYFNQIHYGTGTGTPTSTDTSLFAFSGSVGLSGDVCEYSHTWHWYSLRRQGQIAEAVAVGQTLTEVGIAHGSGASALCTHAMLRDMNGNQISIYKTDTDVINIYATVFVHWPDNLVNGGVQLLPYAFTNDGFLAYLAGRYNVGDSRSGKAAKPPGFAVSTTGRKFATYGGDDSSMQSIEQAFNPTNKTITLLVSRMPVGDGNWNGGIRGIIMCLDLDGARVAPALYLETGKSDWFPGSTITGEAVGTGDGVTLDFATAFDDPEAATIYVDGVIRSDVTVDKTPISISNMARFFQTVEVENGVAYPGINEKGTSSEYCLDGIYFNPYWEYGIDNFDYDRDVISVCVSDDLVNWDYVFGSPNATGGSKGSCAVPAKLQFRKYWGIQILKRDYGVIRNLTSPALTGKNIHFATPPAAGAVITADYYTKRIAKDSNHVFDLTLTIQLGERTM